jgi:hypothetical protein
LIGFYSAGSARNGTSETFSNIMLNAGSTALPYEPYYEGLRSAKVTEVKSVGVNLWDEQWEVGGLDADDGETYYATDRIRGVNYCHCLPNTQYWVPPYIHLVFYNKDKSYVGQTAGNKVITTPNNAHYFKVCGTTGYGAVYKYDLCINESVGAIDGKYFPSIHHSLPILPEEVRPANGINENVYDYIEWAEDGSQKQGVRCGVVDLGTLAWQVESNYAYSFSLNPVAKSGGDLLYTNLPIGVRMSGIDTAQSVVVGFDEGRYDAASFKAAMSGVMLVYELAEPIVTDISSLITSDNLLSIQGGGTLAFENEYGYDVPSTVEYITAEATA